MRHLAVSFVATILTSVLGAQAPTFKIQKATLTAGEEIVLTAKGVTKVLVENGFAQSSTEFDLLKTKTLTLGKPKAFESAQIIWSETKGDKTTVKAVVVFCAPSGEEDFTISLSAVAERKLDPATAPGLLDRFADGVTAERLQKALGKIDWHKWAVENAVDLTTTGTVCTVAIFVPGVGAFCGKQVAGHAKDLSFLLLDNLIAGMEEDKVITAQERADIQTGVLIAKTLGGLPSVFKARGSKLYFKLFETGMKALEAHVENDTAKLTIRYVRDEAKKVYILIQVGQKAGIK